jgi:serine protease Do
MHRQWSSVAMKPRAVFFWSSTVVVCALALSAQAHAQSSARDSGRVIRLRLQRAGDTVYVRNLHATREQLLDRLDSLQREFEDLGANAPDRVDLVRELSTIISSLGDLSQLEQHARLRTIDQSATSLREKTRALTRTQVLVGPMLRRTEQTVQPGWVGINAEAPHQRVVRNDSAFIRYFSYPEVVSVEPNSPAERAGISRGDRLVAYNGADLRDREINMTKLLQPSRRLNVTVQRDGEERDFSVIVARLPARIRIREQLASPDLLADSAGMTGRMLRMPRFEVAPTPPGVAPVTILGGMQPGTLPVAGATLIAIKDESLGHIFGVSSGVLIAEVFGDPAQSSGLKGGDVVRRADGDDVTDVAQLRRIIDAHSGDRIVELEIVRQKRTRSITLRW